MDQESNEMVKPMDVLSEKSLNPGRNKGTTLEWSNIHYTLSNKDGQKVLLHSMSGKALPGEMLGILGTSGAG